VERDYKEWDNFSHSPQRKHLLTSIQSESMTKQQRIEAAKQRIAELERLIKAWKTKS
jgi:predicted S18 family serine protease